MAHTHPLLLIRCRKYSRHMYLLLFSLQVTHRDELKLSEATIKKVGNTKEELMKYMMDEFPDLLLYVWLGASKCRSDGRLKDYYTGFYERFVSHGVGC